MTKKEMHEYYRPRIVKLSLYDLETLRGVLGEFIEMTKEKYPYLVDGYREIIEKLKPHKKEEE